MDIFKDTRSKVIFAFTMAAYPGDTPASNTTMMLQALRQVDPKAASMMTSPAAASMLREQAQLVLAIIHAQLLPIHAAALIARYSKDWPARRTACHLLRAHLQRPVEKLLDNPPAVEKLVQRHYIVERDRSGQWDVAQIAADHHASLHAVRQAWSVMVLYADQLERAALEALEHALAKEAAHA